MTYEDPLGSKSFERLLYQIFTTKRMDIGYIIITVG